MRRNNRESSVRVKLLIPIIIVNIFTFLTIGAVIDSTVRRNLIEQGRDSARSIGNLTVSQLDLEDIKHVVSERKRDEAYWRLFHKLEEVEEKTDIVWAYLLMQDKERNTFNYLVVTTDTDENAFEEVYPEYMEDARRSFEDPNYYSERIEYSRYGKLLTISVPVYDESGEMIAVLSVDYNAAKVINASAKVKFFISVMCVAFSIILSLISILLINTLLDRLNIVGNKMKELTSNQGNLTQRLEDNSNDEIGQITRNMNEMLEYIQSTVLIISLSSNRLSNSLKKLTVSVEESVQGTVDASSAIEEIHEMMQNTCAGVEMFASMIAGMKESIARVCQQVNAGQVQAKKYHAQAEQAVKMIDNCKHTVRVMEEGLAKEMQQVLDPVSESVSVIDVKLNTVANLYLEGANDLMERYSNIQQEMSLLEEGIHAIDAATSEVRNSIDNNTNELAQVADTILRLNQIIHHNQDAVEESIMLTRKLSYEVNKFIYES